jgi:hypothetical protein
MVVCRYEEVRLETGPTPLAPFVSCRNVKTPAHGRDGRATTFATIVNAPEAVFLPGTTFAHHLRASRAPAPLVRVYRNSQDNDRADHNLLDER